jgi:hypothetical protein
MRTLQDFSELVDHICKRHLMYVCGGSFYEVCAFISGFEAAMDCSPFGTDHHTSFSAFVAARMGYPQKLAWPYVLKTATPTDDQAIALLRNLLSEYIEAVRDDRVSELLTDTKAKLAAREQNPPEQVTCWRDFCRALHRGDKDVLKRLGNRRIPNVSFPSWTK